MDELDKLRDEMAFLRGRVAAMEERNEDLSERLRIVLAMYDDHLKRMSHVLDQVEYMNKRLLDGERHL
jgi:predicted nuclease with TOPRIM domain